MNSLLLCVCIQKTDIETDTTQQARTHNWDQNVYLAACKTGNNQHSKIHSKDRLVSFDQRRHESCSEDVIESPTITHIGMKSHRRNKCDNVTVLAKNLVRPMRPTTGEKEYNSDEVDFVTAHRSHLGRHIESHTGGKRRKRMRSYKCDQCGNQTTHTKHLFVNASTQTDEKEKPYNCGQCEYRAAKQGQLKSHMRTHTGEKPYECDVCDYKSSWKASINKHKKTHSKCKPYKCDLCDFETAWKDCLIRDMKAQHR